MSDSDFQVAGAPGGERDSRFVRVAKCIERHTAAMMELGIIYADCHGEMVHRGDHVLIGELVLLNDRRRNLVKIVPRHGVDMHQRVELERAAQYALVAGPDPAFGWREHRGLGRWFQMIWQPIALWGIAAL
ncbi:hypothetical protein [Nocardia tengchongensis]|uniref:hypothetical protein n=1 Tax=Nocardia tengchongensis TaxID=2055889 RepID=UPI0036172EFC